MHSTDIVKLAKQLINELEEKKFDGSSRKVHITLKIINDLNTFVEYWDPKDR